MGCKGAARLGLRIFVETQGTSLDQAVRQHSTDLIPCISSLSVSVRQAAMQPRGWTTVSYRNAALRQLRDTAGRALPTRAVYLDNPHTILLQTSFPSDMAS